VCSRSLCSVERRPEDELAYLLKYLAPLHSTGKWLLLSVIVGAVAGVGAIAFDIANQSIHHLALERIAGYVPAETAGENRIVAVPAHPEFSPLSLIAVISVGGFLSGLLVIRFAPEAEGHGTDAAIAAFHHKRGFIRPIVPVPPAWVR
jgi:chloride channel protein, CIC family